MRVHRHRPKWHGSRHGYKVPSHWQSHDSRFAERDGIPRHCPQRSRQKLAHDLWHSRSLFVQVPLKSDAINDACFLNKEPIDEISIRLWSVPRDVVYDKP